MFSLILVPLDGSDVAARAVPAAAEMARRFEARLLLVQAVETRSATLALGANALTGSMTDPELIGGQVQAEIAAAEAYLSATQEQLAAENLAAEYQVLEGDGGTAIVAAAEAQGADLIVMTSHGRGAFGRLVFGSTANHVAANATAPVLILREHGTGNRE